MAGKTGAKKKKELDPEVEARMLELVQGVKKAKSLDELLAALRAVVRGGEAGQEAVWKLRPPAFTFPTFGPPPDGEEPAVSWDKTRLLVVEEEGFSTARLVARRDVDEASAPKAPSSRQQPRAENDGELQEGASDVASDETPLAPAAAVEALGADPNEVAAALIVAFPQHGITARRVTAKRRSGGGGVVSIVPNEGPTKTIDLGPEVWSESLQTIVGGIVESMSVGD